MNIHLTIFFCCLLVLCIFLQVILLIARFFIKDPVNAKKRTFLALFLLFVKAILVFFVALISLIGIGDNKQDFGLWIFILIACIPGIFGLGYSIYKVYPLWWLQTSEEKP